MAPFPGGGRCVIAEHPPGCDAGKQVRGHLSSRILTVSVEIPTGENWVLRSLRRHRGLLVDLGLRHQRCEPQTQAPPRPLLKPCSSVTCFASVAGSLCRWR